MDISSFFFAGWRSLARILLVGAPAYLFLLALLHVAGKHSLAKSVESIRSRASAP